MTTRVPSGHVRVAAIYVDCPRECRGGGLDSSDGSFMLDSLDGHKPGEVVTCHKCRQPFRIPQHAFRSEGWS
jgi:hypothetical protein